MIATPASAISLRGLSKEFRMRTERRRMGLLGNFGDFFKPTKPFLALDEINLEVPRGETLGIIGMNGSGKSTMLKIIAGISPATRGEINVNGQVGSLIELGAGFHPELSGYENVYLNGTILGIKRSDLDDMLPAIIEFSALEEFMDMPVKHYSSGMQMRLGFSIAIQLKPDILLLDETMSVGDAEFQSRALKAMRDYRATGSTTLMVSHDVFSIREYCDRVLWLHKGKTQMLGDPKEVVDAYIDFLMSLSHEDSHLFARHGHKVYNEPPALDPPITITQLDVLDDAGNRAAKLDHPSRITLRISYKCRRPVAQARVCVALIVKETNLLGMEKDSVRDGQSIVNLKDTGSILFSFEADQLYSENFTFIAALYNPSDSSHCWCRESTDFDLVGRAQPTPKEFHYLLAPCKTYEHRLGGA